MSLTATMQQWVNGQQNPEVVVNENFVSVQHTAVYAMNPDTTTLLTWGYLGGRWGGFAVTAGTLTLTASQTNYVVVQRSDGAISTSTTNTNWNDTTNYARVFQITTGTTTVSAVQDHRAGPGGVHGQAASGGGADLDLDGTPAADDTYEGITISGINAGATTAQWDAVYLGSGGEWLLADASDDTTAPARGIGVAAGSDNNPLTVLVQGVIRNDAWAWTPGGAIYLSTTAGGLTQTAPSAAGEIVQQVGFALSADVAYIAIGDATFIEVAA